VLARYVLVLGAACHPPAAPPVEPAPPAMVTAPSPPQRCNELATCVAACEAGDDVACRRLANLAAYGLGVAARAQIFPTLERSCAAAHVSSCVWTPFCQGGDRGLTSCDPAWLASMASLCDREAAACSELTSIYAQLGDTTEELRWRTRAIAKADAECAGGDPFSCYAWWYGFQFYRPQRDLARAAAILDRIMPVLQRGCDLGDAIQCVMVIQIWNQNEPGHEAAQQAATERACQLAPETLCAPKP